MTSHVARHCKALSYVYYPPSQGPANRSASGGFLGAMYRPASVSPFFNTPSRKREGGNGSSFPLASLFLATYVTLLVLNHAVLNNKKVLKA